MYFDLLDNFFDDFLVISLENHKDNLWDNLFYDLLEDFLDDFWMSSFPLFVDLFWAFFGASLKYFGLFKAVLQLREY